MTFLVLNSVLWINVALGVLIIDSIKRMKFFDFQIWSKPFLRFQSISISFTTVVNWVGNC